VLRVSTKSTYQWHRSGWPLLCRIGLIDGGLLEKA
jgi:hypothetical protein